MVVKVEKTKDGAYRQKGIQKFGKGHLEIYKQYVEEHKAQKKKIRQKLLQQYVEDHQLDIIKYHEYGWDPVTLFPEK